MKRRVPIVFANVTDPVAAGFVESLARPGGRRPRGARGSERKTMDFVRSRCRFREVALRGLFFVLESAKPPMGLARSRMIVGGGRGRRF
jgi:hypothetical protein